MSESRAPDGSSFFNVDADFKVHVPNLLEEILRNRECAALRMPLRLLASTLRRVAVRANELQDPKLTALVMSMALYEIGDPEHKDYDPKVMAEVFENAELQHAAEMVEGRVLSRAQVKHKTKPKSAHWFNATLGVVNDSAAASLWFLRGYREASLGVLVSPYDYSFGGTDLWQLGADLYHADHD